MMKLSAAELERALPQLTDWRIDGGKLYREFRFGDFPRAIGFMMAVAVHAEAKNHHPEWLNVYDTVRVWLVTHDVGGISEKDLNLAQFMNDVHQTR